MSAIPRVLAVLQDGAQHGRRFSVAADTAGGPPDLLVGEERYAPEVELDHHHDLAAAVRLQQRLNAGETVDEQAHPLFHGFELHVPDDLEDEGVVRGHHFVAVWLYRRHG